MPEPMSRDPMIGQALDLEKLFLQSREERLNYLMSYKAMRDAMTMDETIRRTAMAEGRAEGKAEGRAEGRWKGQVELLFSLVRDGLLSVEEASSRAGMTKDAFVSRMGKAGKSSARLE